MDGDDVDIDVSSIIGIIDSCSNLDDVKNLLCTLSIEQISQLLHKFPAYTTFNVHHRKLYLEIVSMVLTHNNFLSIFDSFVEICKGEQIKWNHLFYFSLPFWFSEQGYYHLRTLRDAFSISFEELYVPLQLFYDAQEKSTHVIVSNLLSASCSSSKLVLGNRSALLRENCTNIVRELFVYICKTGNSHLFSLFPYDRFLCLHWTFQCAPPSSLISKSFTNSCINIQEAIILAIHSGNTTIFDAVIKLMRQHTLEFWKMKPPQRAKKFLKLFTPSLLHTVYTHSSILLFSHILKHYSVLAPHSDKFDLLRLLLLKHQTRYQPVNLIFLDLLVQNIKTDQLQAEELILIEKTISICDKLPQFYYDIPVHQLSFTPSSLVENAFTKQVSGNFSLAFIIDLLNK